VWSDERHEKGSRPERGTSILAGSADTYRLDDLSGGQQRQLPGVRGVGPFRSKWTIPSSAHYAASAAGVM